MKDSKEREEECFVAMESVNCWGGRGVYVHVRGKGGFEIRLFKLFEL